jgi:hypothetical protein
MISKRWDLYYLFNLIVQIKFEKNTNMPQVYAIQKGSSWLEEILQIDSKLLYLGLYYSLGWTSSQDYTLARDR